MLHIHPDKNTDHQATEKSRVLNDAKDRAINQCQMRHHGPSSWTQFYEECNRKEDERRKEEEKQEEEIKRKIDELRKEAERYRAEARQRAEQYKEEKRRKEEQDKEEKRQKEERDREEKRLREEKEMEERRQKEERETPIYATAELFLTQHARVEYAEGYPMFTKINDLEEKCSAQHGKKTSIYCRPAALYHMAETINKNTADSISAKKLESELREEIRQLEAKLAHERAARDNTQQQLAEMAAKSGVEQKANDDVRQRLAEMAVKLGAEQKAKDDARQQLAEMEQRYEEVLRVKDGLTKQFDDAKPRLADMAKMLHSERESKEESHRKLVDTVKELEVERESKDNALLQLATLTADYDAFRQEVEVKLKSADKLQCAAGSFVYGCADGSGGGSEKIVSSDAADSSEPVQLSHKRKRSTSDDASVDSGYREKKTIKTTEFSLLADVTIFVEQNLVQRVGHMITTKQIQEAFIEMYTKDDVHFSERAFEKTLKECIEAKYSDTSKVFPSRTTQSGKRSRGYVGLGLVVAK